MPSPATTVVGGIFSFPLIQLIELCFSAYSIANSENFANFAVTLRRETPQWSRNEGGHYIMKAFTALDSWLSEMWQFLNHRQE